MMKKKDSPDPLPRPTAERPRRKLSPVLFSAWPLGAVGLAAGASVVAIVALADQSHKNGSSSFVDELLHRAIHPRSPPVALGGDISPVTPPTNPSATLPCSEAPNVPGAVGPVQSPPRPAGSAASVPTGAPVDFTPTITPTITPTASPVAPMPPGKRR
jgi:hypothetical protein